MLKSCPSVPKKNAITNVVVNPVINKNNSCIDFVILEEGTCLRFPL